MLADKWFLLGHMGIIPERSSSVRIGGNKILIPEFEPLEYKIQNLPPIPFAS